MTAGLYTFPAATSATLADLGLAAGPVLRAAGLPEDLFLDPQISLTADQFYRCWTAAEEITGDPALGATLAAHLSAETFQPPVFAALCSPDLQHAAERLAVYKRLMGPQRLVVSAAATGCG